MNANMPLELTVLEEQSGQRIDKVLAHLLTEMSRSHIQILIKNHNITVDGKPCRVCQKVYSAQSIHVTLPQQFREESWHEAEEGPLDTVYADDDLLIINKPAGLVVHPGAGCLSGTLLNYLMWHYPELKLIPRAGIIHRLDKDTTGLMLIARNERSLNILSKQLRDRHISRMYYALVYGTPPAKGEINAAIGRHHKQRTKMCVTHFGGKEAITYFERCQTFIPYYSLLKCSLHTGRTHQIRVHMKHLGYPLVGDTVYGKRSEKFFGRQALHAFHLIITHPTTKEKMEWQAAMPADFDTLLKKLRDKNNISTKLNTSYTGLVVTKLDENEE